MERWIRFSLVLVIVGMFAACGGDDSGGDGGGPSFAGGGVVQRALDQSTKAPMPLGAPEEATGGSAGGGGSGNLSAAVLPDLGPNVIKNASIALGVKEDRVDDAVREATSLAARHGGFVLSSGMSQKPQSGAVVIRVPSGSFEATLADLKDLGRVRDERISGEDVSLEFVDLQARLRNLSVQETVLLRLMGRSQSIADTIRVQRQLEGIQLDIERIRGRLRFLNDQTSYGTIEMSVTEIGAVPAGTPILTRAWNEATEVFLKVVGAGLIVAVTVAPFALLALIGLLIFRRVVPKGRLRRGEV